MGVLSTYNHIHMGQAHMWGQPMTGLVGAHIFGEEGCHENGEYNPCVSIKVSCVPALNNISTAFSCVLEI